MSGVDMCLLKLLCFLSVWPPVQGAGINYVGPIVLGAVEWPLEE